MFRRNKQQEEAIQAEEPQEPGLVEGPYEIDMFDAPPPRYLDLQDLMNARHQEGFELVWMSTPRSGTLAIPYAVLLVWRKGE